MGLGSILILLVLLVSVIVFIYIIVVTAKGWGALHTSLLCILFIECWVFIVFAAGVQGTRVKFTKEADKQRTRAEAAIENTQQLLWGRFDVNSVNLDAVIPVKNELRRMTNDRGRVWRNVNLIQSVSTGFELEFSAPQAAADDLTADPVDGAAASTPSSESLPVDLVVYAFAEELNEQGKPIPQFYLGEHTVTKSVNGAVTLEPTIELNAAQKSYIGSGAAASWTLYELLPLDSHQAFAAPGSERTDEDIFGRMDEETLAQLFALVPEDRRQQVIDSYLRDGKQANADDPSENRWHKVKILQEFETDVDSDEVADATERGYFDTIGRSIDVRLKRDGEGENGTVSLDPQTNERVVLAENAYLNLSSQGKVESEFPIYVRKLNDYEQAFNNHAERMHDVAERIDLFKREAEQLSQANLVGQQLISQEQIETEDLQSDLDNYRREVTVLNDAVATATADLKELKSRLTSLYQKIQSRSYSSF